jgi:hypothetical protein
MKILLTNIFVSMSLILLSACDSDLQENQLVSFVENNNFDNPQFVFLEKRGSFITDKWYKVTLYFGYADNWNWDSCIDEANRLNSMDIKDAYRCVLPKRN